MTVRQTVSEHGLVVRVQHHHNPYNYMLDDEQLAELLLDLGLGRSASIWRNHTVAPSAAPRDTYGRASMGFVLMDPTAGPWVPDEQAVLGVITVGEDSQNSCRMPLPRPPATGGSGGTTARRSSSTPTCVAAAVSATDTPPGYAE
ncbi:hypothetical protein ACWGI8_21320 [Streptomyces sp. NPDC054841]